MTKKKKNSAKDKSIDGRLKNGLNWALETKPVNAMAGDGFHSVEHTKTDSIPGTRPTGAPSSFRSGRRGVNENMSGGKVDLVLQSNA